MIEKKKTIKYNGGNIKREKKPGIKKVTAKDNWRVTVKDNWRGIAKEKRTATQKASWMDIGKGNPICWSSWSAKSWSEEKASL